MRYYEHLKTTRVQQSVYAQSSEASAVIKDSIQEVIATLDEQIAQIERQIRLHFNDHPDRREEAQRAVMPIFQAAGPAKIAAMRAAGHDPTATSEAQRRRAASASQRRKAVVAWHDDGSLEGVDFKRDILPRLQGIPVRVIAEAMGASISHGSKVRNGRLIPHRRHWASLVMLISKRD